uniref:Uncharacterized protein n=1 Tax=Arundo donax TaxID=35708 RepID=A0A0A9CCY5_ARUDO
MKMMVQRIKMRMMVFHRAHLQSLSSLPDGLKEST